VVKPGREEALMARFRRWGPQGCRGGTGAEENVWRRAGNTVRWRPRCRQCLADDTRSTTHELLAEPPAEDPAPLAMAGERQLAAARCAKAITPASGQLLPWGRFQGIAG